MLELWDIKKLDKEVDSIVVNSSMDTFNPFIDRELKLLYLVGPKEIDIYDYTKNKYKELLKFNYKEISHHSILFNRKCLNKEKSEIDRFLRYSRHNKKIYYLSFMLDNKEEFGDNLYPETQIGNDLISYEQWIQDKPDNPINELSERKKKFIEEKYEKGVNEI